MATYQSRPVTFTGTPGLRFTSAPVTFSAPAAYFLQRTGNRLIPTQVFRRQGDALIPLSPEP